MPLQKRFHLPDTSVNVSYTFTSTAVEPRLETYRCRPFSFTLAPTCDVQLRRQFTCHGNQRKTIQRPINFPGCVLQAVLLRMLLNESANLIYDPSTSFITLLSNLRNKGASCNAVILVCRFREAVRKSGCIGVAVNALKQ